jgi:hypothetical protein
MESMETFHGLTAKSGSSSSSSSSSDITTFFFGCLLLRALFGADSSGLDTRAAAGAAAARGLLAGDFPGGLDVAALAAGDLGVGAGLQSQTTHTGNSKERALQNSGNNSKPEMGLK